MIASMASIEQNVERPGSSLLALDSPREMVLSYHRSLASLGFSGLVSDGSGRVSDPDMQ